MPGPRPAAPQAGQLGHRDELQRQPGGGEPLKDADRAEILRGIRPAHGGEVVFSAGVAAKVLGWFGGRPSGSPFPHLTDRERDVLDLVAHGLTNSAIAARLTVAEKTVRNHVSNVLAKLHVETRAGRHLRP